MVQQDKECDERGVSNQLISAQYNLQDFRYWKRFFIDEKWQAVETAGGIEYKDTR